METVIDFSVLGCKITANGDCSHEIKRCLLLGRRSNLDSLDRQHDQPRQHIKKQRHYFANKVHPVKAMFFPTIMYGCESWTVKKVEHQKIDGLELWCWRRLLRVPWIARRSNQSTLKETSPEYSLEGLRLKLKLQHFGHLTRRADSFEKTLMLGGIEGRKRMGRQRTRWLDGITDSMDTLLLLLLSRFSHDQLCATP